MNNPNIALGSMPPFPMTNMIGPNYMTHPPGAFPGQNTQKFVLYVGNIGTQVSSFDQDGREEAHGPVQTLRVAGECEHPEGQLYTELERFRLRHLQLLLRSRNSKNQAEPLHHRRPRTEGVLQEESHGVGSPDLASSQKPTSSCGTCRKTCETKSWRRSSCNTEKLKAAPSSTTTAAGVCATGSPA